MATNPEPRIPPLSPREWSPAMKDATAPLIPTTPRPPGLPRGLNILGTFAHHPDLAAAFWVFNGHLLNRSRLTSRQLELTVLRVASLCNSDYEWKQHVVAARACGITEDEIAAIEARATTREAGTHEAGTHEWSTADEALLTAVEELVESTAVSDATWAVLSASMDEQQVLDLVFTVGAYLVIAMMLSVAGTPLDDDLR